MIWALLAPGPSATAEQAQAVHEAGIPLGAIGNAFELAPHAKFIAASDGAWWRKHPDALKRDVPRYCMHVMSHVTRIQIPQGIVNSGVLGLEIAKREGASRILLLGFDMHGTHFFGPYNNGLRNTAPHQRQNHLKQYAEWAKINRRIEVVNCTPGSALTCFPTARLEDELAAYRECA